MPIVGVGKDEGAADRGSEVLLDKVWAMVGDKPVFTKTYEARSTGCSRLEQPPAPVVASERDATDIPIPSRQAAAFRTLRVGTHSFDALRRPVRRGASARAGSHAGRGNQNLYEELLYFRPIEEETRVMRRVITAIVASWCLRPHRRQSFQKAVLSRAESAARLDQSTKTKAAESAASLKHLRRPRPRRRLPRPPIASW